MHQWVNGKSLVLDTVQVTCLAADVIPAVI